MSDRPLCIRPGCSRPPHDNAYVCAPCGTRLERDMWSTALLAYEPETTITKQDRIGAGGRRTETGSLPFKPGLREIWDQIAMEVETWARHVAYERRRRFPHSLTRAAILLADPDNVRWLRHRPEAEEAFEGLHAAAQALQRIVDRPPDRWYAGLCACGAKLWPPAGATTVRCGECGTGYDASHRRSSMLAEAAEMWLTAAWCGHVLTSFGVRCTPAMVRGYALRGRLAPHPDPDPMGYPRYRLGSVRELILEQQAEQRNRRLMAAVRQAEAAERQAKRARTSQPA